MVEYDDLSVRIFISRLNNLLAQIEHLLSEDFPNRDIFSAANSLKEAVIKQIDTVRASKDFSSRVVEGIFSDTAIRIENYSYIIGVLLRSSVTRNPFELYHPFKVIAQKFFAEAEVRLVLSSEWDYIPFTHPMNIDDLPRFIIIGMPAVEADNVLVFPAAGHELGHSIWQRCGLVDEFSPIVKLALDDIIASDASFWRSLFPEDVELTEHLKRTAIARISHYARKQLEELFCDFVAVHIFGFAYSRSFRYILSGGGQSSRDGEYPDIKERAELVATYTMNVGFDAVDLGKWFAEQIPNPLPAMERYISVADDVRRSVTSKVMDRCTEVVMVAGIAPPSMKMVVDAADRFRLGTPVASDASLGELICAAWTRYEEDGGSLSEQALVARLSNLVLKSAEAAEYTSRMSIAG
jgi:hypothetical protein